MKSSGIVEESDGVQVDEFSLVVLHFGNCLMVVDEAVEVRRMEFVIGSANCFV